MPGDYDRGVILRCTRKILAVIGPAVATSPGPAPSPEDWYANLLRRNINSTRSHQRPIDLATQRLS